MSLIKPFAGLRPAPGKADEVVAPPYDVMSRAEAKEMAAGRPWSFLHISRAEIDLPDEVDPHDPRVYAKARENLDRMRAEGVLEQDPAPAYYVYRLTMGAHVQTGIVAAASVEAYESGRIKKHEFTRPVKEDDRVRQIEALDAQTGPVFLVYRSDDEIDATLAALAESEPPAIDVTARDGVRHQVWHLAGAGALEGLTAAFDRLDALYVADGHHRSAAAARVAAARRQANPSHHGGEDYDYFLSVIFPHDQMQILDYNRVVREFPAGLGPAVFLERVADAFTVEPSDIPVKPTRSGEYGMYLGGRWYRLAVDPVRVPADDPVARLDVSVLQDNLIEPVLGISDPRRDDRIDFVGGIRGLGELARRVDEGWAVAFALYPTSMEALMAVADAGDVMPPKSTWFEPKLADGLVSHLLD
ncbi:MAG: DUF1015 family protein [Gammaproteobacteria bacterium]|jgi:uncharacterized protein (DUF1015 family)